MRPFFSYYGSKWLLIPHYPPPKYSTIIEPFAGSACYALRHNASKVKLYELDEMVYGVWKYLIGSSPEDIMSLPADIDHIDNLNICQEAKWLIGFWLNKGGTSPMKTPSKWMRLYKNGGNWSESIKTRIASQLSGIKHWEVFNTSYVNIPNEEASWFIDPPYQNYCGRRYRKNKIDYCYLSEWCINRMGQAMVCEQQGADWLPFLEFKSMRATNTTTKRSVEVLWTKENPPSIT